MPKCSFCECDIPLPVSGNILETECPRCGRPIEINPQDLLRSASTFKALSLVARTSGKCLELPIGESLILGREGYGSDVFQDRKFSRKHCLIETNIQAITICDLGSLNGTFVNGERISAKTTLKDDDIITLADEEYILKQKTPDTQDTKQEAPGSLHICANCGYQDNKGQLRCPDCGFGWE